MSQFLKTVDTRSVFDRSLDLTQTQEVSSTFSMHAELSQRAERFQKQVATILSHNKDLFFFDSIPHQVKLVSYITETLNSSITQRPISFNFDKIRNDLKQKQELRESKQHLIDDGIQFLSLVSKMTDQDKCSVLRGLFNANQISMDEIGLLNLIDDEDVNDFRPIFNMDLLCDPFPLINQIDMIDTPFAKFKDDQPDIAEMALISDEKSSKISDENKQNIHLCADSLRSKFQKLNHQLSTDQATREMFRQLGLKKVGDLIELMMNDTSYTEPHPSAASQVGVTASDLDQLFGTADISVEKPTDIIQPISQKKVSGFNLAAMFKHPESLPPDQSAENKSFQLPDSLNQPENCSKGLRKQVDFIPTDTTQEVSTVISANCDNAMASVSETNSKFSPKQILHQQQDIVEVVLTQEVCKPKQIESKEQADSVRQCMNFVDFPDTSSLNDSQSADGFKFRLQCLLKPSTQLASSEFNKITDRKQHVINAARPIRSRSSSRLQVQQPYQETTLASEEENLVLRVNCSQVDNSQTYYQDVMKAIVKDYFFCDRVLQTSKFKPTVLCNRSSMISSAQVQKK